MIQEDLGFRLFRSVCWRDAGIGGGFSTRGGGKGRESSKGNEQKSRSHSDYGIQHHEKRQNTEQAPPPSHDAGPSLTLKKTPKKPNATIPARNRQIHTIKKKKAF